MSDALGFPARVHKREPDRGNINQDLDSRFRGNDEKEKAGYESTHSEFVGLSAMDV
jgi:hypothetical protein